MVTTRKATAIAHPNIAFVKYWGKRDPELNIPMNNSISMNLDGLFSKTSVEFSDRYGQDSFELQGEDLSDQARAKAKDAVFRQLDRVRRLADIRSNAKVVSKNSFPMSAGLASSASSAASLTLAASTAAGLDLTEKELSILARQGSGSACRSIPSGYVEWFAGESSDESFAVQIEPPGHWDLRDIIAVISTEEKEVGSREGHIQALLSPFYDARLQTVERRIATVKDALRERSFATLGQSVEQEAISLHVITMTSPHPHDRRQSGIYYWEPGTMSLIRDVQRWRRGGVEVYFTIDAGPNVHLICEAPSETQVIERLKESFETIRGKGYEAKKGRDFRVTRPGGGASLIERHLF